MTRNQVVLALAGVGLCVVALAVTVRLTRYETVTLQGQAMVLDRWRHELCTVSPAPRCFPVR